jgi:16S rRNA (cytosine1402-N4)-methyltransferase
MHTPVLLNEAIDALQIKPNGLYIDATFGRGGHSQAILHHLDQGRLWVIDKDPEAIKVANELAAEDARVTVCHSSFSEIESLSCQYGIKGKVDGILMDLGVSSPQLDQADRGFSFMQDGPLDMRMDTTRGESAAVWLSHVKVETLVTVLKDYGEERFAKRISSAIVSARETTPIETTKQLADIVSKAHPRWEMHKHPATRSFQAIRIFINRELDDLKIGLAQSEMSLVQGGRLVVISFHSLEDRIVKHYMRERASGVALPRGVPMTETELDKTRFLNVIGKACKPTKEETGHNVRARSATLRVAEKR